MKTILFTLFVAFTFNSTLLQAQKDIYNHDIASDIGTIKWMEQLVNGTILIGGEDALAAYENKTGELIWKDDVMSRSRGESFYPIKPLNLFGVRARNDEGNESNYIIQSETGEKIFKTRDKIIQFTQNEDDNALYLELDGSEDHKLVKIDLKTNQIAWELPLSDKGGIKSTSIGKSIFVAKSQFNEKAMVLGKDKFLYCVDKSNGSILWEKSYKYEIQFFELIDNGSKLMVISDKRLNILDPNSGDVTSSEPIKVKNVIDWTDPISENKLLVASKNSFNIYNINEGKMQFPKDFSHYGVKNIDRLDSGNILSYGGSKMTCIGKDGKSIWSKTVSNSLKDIIFYSDELFICEFPSSIEFRNMSNGKTVKKSRFSFAATSPTYHDIDENKYLAFTGKKLVSFDLSNYTKTALTEKIKLKKYSAELDVLTLEKRENGYLISSGQHLAFINFDGKLKFNKNFPINKKSAGLGHALLAAELGTGMADAMLDDGKRTTSQKTQEYKGSIGYVNFNTKRLNASYVSDQYLFTFTKEKDKPCFKKVDKDSGEVVLIIPMKDKDPTFVLDEYDKLLIIAEGDNVLRAVQL